MKESKAVRRRAGRRSPIAIRGLLGLVGVVTASLLTGTTPAMGAPLRPTGVARAAVEDALRCPDRLGRRPVVLLIHGTGSTGGESWSETYEPALTVRRFDVCTVDVIGREVGDMQDSSAFVAETIRAVFKKAGRPIAVIGHSQGAMLPRAAVKWWPDLSTKITDIIMLAGPHHGTGVADFLCEKVCVPAVWQLRAKSAFIAALNESDESPGRPSYTSIRSTTDEVVFPESTAKVSGAVNVAVQDLCPGRKVSHVGMIVDNVAFAVTLDALRNPGPAKVDRIAGDVCDSAYVNGMNPAAADEAGKKAGAALANGLVASEPPLRSPAV